MLGESESYVYLPFYKRAYLNEVITSNYRYISASPNDDRIGFFGAGIQAGIHTTGASTQGYNLPVIKLPRNTVSITISFNNTSRLYNNNDVFVKWMKDIPSGTTYPSLAYFCEPKAYNARANNSALKINTLEVPEDADSFIGVFRIYPSIGSEETEETIASDVGFSITFNKA